MKVINISIISLIMSVCKFHLDYVNTDSQHGFKKNLGINLNN